MDAETVDPIREPTFTFPPDEGELVAREFAHATSILEYGSGGSTVLAARSTQAKVLSIESDKDWADKMTSFLKAQDLGGDRVKIHWSDVGPTGKWGYPKDQSKFRKYPNYAFCPWEDFEVTPDVVLIDGRFRLACFAATLLFVKKPTTVLFGEYNARNAYKPAGQFAQPVKSMGRMAKFVIKPRNYSAAEFATMTRWFFALV